MMAFELLDAVIGRSWGRAVVMYVHLDAGDQALARELLNIMFAPEFLREEAKAEMAAAELYSLLRTALPQGFEWEDMSDDTSEVDGA